MSVQPIDDDYNYDKSKWIKVKCRLCGQEWLYPKRYEKVFNAEYPLENCGFCRSNPMLRLRNL
jgi:hypothetical protein